MLDTVGWLTVNGDVVGDSWRSLEQCVRAGAPVRSTLRFERAAYERGCEGEWLDLSLHIERDATRWEVERIPCDLLLQVGDLIGNGLSVEKVGEALKFKHHEAQKLRRWAIDEGLVAATREAS